MDLRQLWVGCIYILLALFVAKLSVICAFIRSGLLPSRLSSLLKGPQSSQSSPPLETPSSEKPPFQPLSENPSSQPSLKTRGLKLPPGPRKLPLLGNVFDIPKTFEWEAFERMGSQFNSDILHLNVIGINLVVLNSVKVARDLLEKRSSIYSSRPKFTLISEVMDFGWMLVFMSYGPAWKDRRRLFQRYFHPSNEALHKPVAIRYTHSLLGRLLDDPEGYMGHVRGAVGATLISLTYGTQAQASGDAAVLLAEEVSEHLSDVAGPATMVFDKMPWLVPILSPFLPGPFFRMTKPQWMDLRKRFRDEPFEHVQKLSREGGATPSLVSTSLEEAASLEGRSKEEAYSIIRDVAAIVFIGGSSTTNAVLHTFFLAMTLFPDVQRRAQAEIDCVIGQSRLPEFSDGQNLPYVGALIKELHRWRPSGPMGIPHLVDQDDEYEGYHIPAGSVVLANVWAMLHDEREYENPSAFNPDRFLMDSKPNLAIRDPSTVNFGFGRRICPGMHIANSTIWIMVTSILSTFTIEAFVNELGITEMPSGEYRSTITFQPLPFKCKIQPRHGKAEELVRAANEELKHHEH